MTLTTALALDCSATGLSLALRMDGEIFEFTTETPRSSDILPTELANLFARSGSTAANLAQVIVTVGPGSFTGIRLGLATAEALRLTHPHLRLAGLSTLEALARQIVADSSPTEPFTLALDAAGGQAYLQTFTATGQPQTPAVCTSPLTHGPTPGTLFASPSLLLPARPLPTLRAAHLFALAEDPARHQPLQPAYLKPLTYKKTGG